MGTYAVAACGTLRITRRGYGVHFKVANLNNLPQAPESVTHLGDLPVRCWVANTDTNTKYTYGRVHSFDTNMTYDTIFRFNSTGGGTVNTDTTVQTDSPTDRRGTDTRTGSQN